MKAASAQPASRNPLAACLAHGAYAPRKVQARKGRGSFQRQPKHRGRDLG